MDVIPSSSSGPLDQPLTYDVTSFMTDGESHVVIGIASGSGGGIIDPPKDRLFDCIYFHMVRTRLMLRFIYLTYKNGKREVILPRGNALVDGK